MTPITFKPFETIVIKIIYRSNGVTELNEMLNIKAITGTICTQEYKIPYHVKVIKSPLHFSALRIDFPVLQINEKYDANLEITNVSHKDQVFEFFLPHPDICGLRITPMVLDSNKPLKIRKKIDINIEFSSKFRKLT